MKIRFYLVALLLIASNISSADDIFYRFGGVIIGEDDNDFGCSVVLGSRWDHCVALQTDALDMEAEDLTIGRYPLDSGEALIGNCRFQDQIVDTNEVIVTDSEWSDGLEVHQKLNSNIPGVNIWWVDMYPWLYDTSTSMFSSDALPLSSAALDLADQRYIEISVLDLEGNFYGHVGSVDDFSISAVPCGDVEDVLTYLMAEVIALNLHAGISNSLDTKLQAVFDTLTDLRGKNIKSAVKRMEAFIHEIEAQRGKHISEEDADHLLELAEAILEMIL